jgi:Zn-dependent protease with chaperone function
VEIALKRFGLLLLIILAIPVFGVVVGSFAKARSESKYFDMIKEKWGEEVAKKATAGEFSLEKVSQRPDLANDSFAQNYNYVRLLRQASLATMAVGLFLPVIILIAGLFASMHRRLLLLLFAPGLKVVLVILFAVILAQGAIATYGVFVLETTLANTFHPFLIGGIGLAAAVGAFSMIAAGFSISKRVSLTIKGMRVSKEDEPALWEFVSDIAKRLSATTPKNIVVGLEPNFYVTNADVTVYPDGAKFSEETLYLSLPFIRILSKDELMAVVGHELGHFRGEDTKYSLKFYPIYAGTGKAIQALMSNFDNGAGSITILPGYAVLMFFMERFAVAESKISRIRELQADKAASEASSSQALISSLLKLGAFAPLWPSVQEAMVDGLNKGMFMINASALYANTAVECFDKDTLFSRVNTSIPHPTDSHPTISQRMENLGFSVDGFKATYAAQGIDNSAIDLLSKPDEIEKDLTMIELRVLLELGLAKVPTDEPAPSEA